MGALLLLSASCSPTPFTSPLSEWLAGLISKVACGAIALGRPGWELTEPAMAAATTAAQPAANAPMCLRPCNCRDEEEEEEPHSLSVIPRANSTLVLEK